MLCGRPTGETKRSSWTCEERDSNARARQRLSEQAAASGAAWNPVQREPNGLHSIGRCFGILRHINFTELLRKKITDL